MVNVKVTNSKEGSGLTEEERQSVQPEVPEELDVTVIRDQAFHVKRCFTFSLITIGFFMIGLISVMVILGLSQPLFGCGQPKPEPVCTESCIFAITETIPDNLTYPDSSPVGISTYEAWLDLIQSAQHTIDIASFYWSMLGIDVIPDPSDWKGEAIFQALLLAGTQRGIKIRIVQNKPNRSYPDQDTEELQKQGAAEIRSLDFNRLLGAGVLHSKMWIVDGTQFFVGSPNMDWRSLTQVKELGAVVQNCPCLVSDMQKIFDVYWILAQNGSVIPPVWPKDLSTKYNKASPMKIKMNETDTEVYLASSPPSFCPEGRTSDIESITDVISKAKHFVDIAVMDYYPMSLYEKENVFWPVIDNLLRQVAIEKGVRVRILTGYWNSTRPIMLNFLESLMALNGTSYHIETKLFVVPNFTEAQAKIPFARVAHNKYMVTDQHSYIGTSNWSEDYFTNTAGIGLIISETERGWPHKTDHHLIRDQLQSIFDRDWSSEYAKWPSDIKV